MQFNTETNGNDIVSEVKSWCSIDDSDTTTYTTTQIARKCNTALDRLHGLIIRADGLWRYDDTNNAGSELLDTSTTVSSARKAAISVTWLKIAMVRFTNAAGETRVLKPANRRNWTQSQLDGDTGDPYEYVLLGNYIYLDATCSGTLEVQYQKGPSYFVPGDTTKTPGFASVFHVLVAYHAALDYCERNDMDSRATKLRNKIGSPPTEGSTGSGMEKELVDFYATRNVELQPTLEGRHEDYGQGALGDYNGNMSGGTNPHGFG